MKVELYPEQWERLALDKPDRLLVARAGFYLGLGFFRIEYLLSAMTPESKRAQLVATAISLGMSEADTVGRLT